MKFTRFKGGTRQYEADIKDVQVPDLWHLGQWLKERGMQKDSDEVLETWRLAIDLVVHLRKEQG